MSKRGGRGGNRNYNNSNGRSGGESSNPNLDQALDIGSKTFNCNKRDVQYFTHNDPFNPKNLLEGGLCRSEGNQFGSLVITHVKGELLTVPDVIYCVPSIQMPYPAEENSWASARQNKKAASQASSSPKQTQSNSPQFTNTNPFAALAESEKQTQAPSAAEVNESVSKYIQFPPYSHVYITTKWNGTNITFFKYHDNEGNEFITAKPRPFATLRDMHQYDCTLSLTKQALNLHPKSDKLTPKKLPDQLAPLLDPSLQSLSFELCGSSQPHLVKYEFDIALKPLFVTKLNGAIVPYGAWVLSQSKGEVPVMEPLPKGAQLLEQDIGPRPFSQEQLISLCDDIKAKALELNEQHRTKLGITSCFYFECFAYEGKVMYLLNDKFETVTRTSIFKIKPKDIEMFHWEQFDAPLQGKAIEALSKVFEKELEVNDANIKAEIDLSERGWYRFSRDIMTMVSAIPNLSRARLHKSLDEMLQAGADQQPWFNEYKQRQKIVLTVGIPGSGKSTFAERLQEQSGWVRVNQDELGTRRAVEVRMEAALKQGLSVIVDRTNFDYQQRNNWVKMAAQYRINTIFCVLFDIDAAVCKSRISVRKNHPTIPEGDSGHVIVDKFTTMLVPPRRGEGFCEIFTVRTDDDIARVMQLLTSLAPKL